VPPLSLLPLSGGALPEAEHAEPAKHQARQRGKKETNSVALLGNHSASDISKKQLEI